MSIFIFDSTPYFLQDSSTEYGISAQQIALFKSVPSAASVFIALLAGNLCSRYGTKRILALGISFYIAAAFIIYLSASKLLLVVGLALFGVACSVSTVCGYSILGDFDLNPSSITVLVSIWSFSGNLAYISSPLLSTIILANPSQSRETISLMWMALISLAALLLFMYRDKPIVLQGRVDYKLPILLGLFFTSIASLPILSEIYPALFESVLVICLGLLGLILLMVAKAHEFRSQMKFLANPAILLGLAALGVNNFVDWNYLSERFLAIRFDLQLTEIAAWLTPSNLSGLLGASFFGFLGLRIGTRKATLTGLLGCLLISVFYILIDKSQSVAVIAIAIAIYVFFDNIVDAGIIAGITKYVPANLLGNLEAVNTITNSIALCFGAEVSSRLFFRTFSLNLYKHLDHLPLDDEKTDLVADLITQGRWSDVSREEFGISVDHLRLFLTQSSLPSVQAVISAFHILGWLCLVAILATLFLYSLSFCLGSRTIAAPRIDKNI